MLDTKDEALKMAIEALEESKVHLGSTKHLNDLIQACKEALKQPSVAELNDEYLRDTYVQGLSQPAQEPVAWMNDIAFSMDKELLGTRSRIVPLYIHPAPAWQGLSDDEKLAIIRKWKDAHTMREQELIGLGDAIEQALKEKNL